MKRKKRLGDSHRGQLVDVKNAAMMAAFFVRDRRGRRRREWRVRRG